MSIDVLHAVYGNKCRQNQNLHIHSLYAIRDKQKGFIRISSEQVFDHIVRILVKCSNIGFDVAMFSLMNDTLLSIVGSIFGMQCMNIMFQT